MYVCNCNGLNDRDVRAAIDAGATKWSDVHAHHGCKVQCGSCATEIAAVINPERRSAIAPLLGRLAPDVS